MKKLIWLGALLWCIQSHAQVTEFKNEGILHLKIHNGMVTDLTVAPDLYVGGMQLTWQYGVVPGRVRLGATGGSFYTGKKVQALAGPTAALLLKSFAAADYGTVGNLHLSLEHLWGSEKQKLVGGGLHADVLNRIALGLTSHYDYEWKNWWIQSVIAIRLSKPKETIREF
ncbi:hypothetical protein [Lunatibacter salilacus]|uniref:hypothetical protein n=1 Tax=Lunatibacter salilacus TaxID=2483804 RepID=UPI00131AE05D|nr:hypothetical protein [Lunatibacter salilacus]